RFLVLDSSLKRPATSQATMPSRPEPLLRRRGVSTARRAPQVKRMLLVALFTLAPLWPLSPLSPPSPASLLSPLPLARAQVQSAPAVYGTVLRGTSYIDVATLRIALGDVVSQGGGILTW